MNREYLVFDLETQRSAHEVGGWNNARDMGLSCAVVYASGTQQFETYYEKDVKSLVERLTQAELVVGFNTLGFDYKVLSGYLAFEYQAINNLDLLADLHRRLKFRVSLDNVAQATLGEKKSANGLQALVWWQEGKLEKIVEYCRQDVLVTKNIYEFGLENDFIRYRRKSGEQAVVVVDWNI